MTLGLWGFKFRIQHEKSLGQLRSIQHPIYPVNERFETVMRKDSSVIVDQTGSPDKIIVIINSWPCASSH